MHVTIISPTFNSPFFHNFQDACRYILEREKKRFDRESEKRIRLTGQTSCNEMIVLIAWYKLDRKREVNRCVCIIKNQCPIVIQNKSYNWNEIDLLDKIKFIYVKW